MNIKLPNAQISITVPVAYQRAVQTLQRSLLQTTPVSSDDVIECVEINKQIPLYKPLDKPILKSKGTLIDIWI